MQSSGWPEALPRQGNLRFPRAAGVSPWFEIYQVTPDTFALIEPKHYEEVISYLILGEQRAVLFDTGMGIGDIRREVEALTSLPVTVVNSHYHNDHVGGNYQFEDVWTFDSDYEAGRIERGMTTAECTHVLRSGAWVELPDGFNPSDYHIRPARVTHRLKHLELIDLGGRVLEVHHTPGHTPGSMCLFDRKHKILFSGDVYYPGMLYADNSDSDLEIYRNSADYLAMLAPGVASVAPAHNVVSAPADALQELRSGLVQILNGIARPEPMEGNRAGYEFGAFRVAVPRDEALRLVGWAVSD